MDKILIGQRIRKQREKLGYTREQMCGIIDKSVNFYADIENGNKGMSFDTLGKISKTLMISTDYILFGNNSLEIDNEAIDLIKICKKENLEDLKTIMRTFIKASNK